MKQRGWLLVFVALLAVAAFLMARSDRPKPPPRVSKVDFPRRATPQDTERRTRRLTLPPVLDADPEKRDPTPRDPLLVALPTDPRKSAFVFEVDDLKTSPIGQIWMDCLLARENQRRDRLEDQLGLDFFEDVERVAFSTERVAVLGLGADTPAIAPRGMTATPHGDRGQIYTRDDEGRGPLIATWGDDMVLVSPDRASLEAALDRLGGKTPPEKPLIPSEASYGDIYGMLSPDDAADLLPPEQAELAARLREAVSKVEIHVDASEDVALVANVDGPDAESVSDLAKSLGAALAVARAASSDEGDDRLAGLLDYASVRPRDGRFSLDLALPIDVLKTLGPCRKRDRPRDRAPEGEPEPEPDNEAPGPENEEPDQP
ncbi:hypothetical protein [Chondromyces apiculatus]|uniref:Uncharacterized protein n=1 Tax=Chondromyces apiculatus DSM 436 TaxID=1192034 RepID=A0A017SWS0_9BACT|nr:hypothetical protein [Chondromyces apiculatus]EYF01212.1 Hypothetical protein CAP_8553 [Chondromyces apiculatus DSM 436]